MASRRDRFQNSSQNCSIRAPFDLQLPHFLRDPNKMILSIDQLEQLSTDDHVRDTALKYLHSHEQFELLWNSNRITPEQRRSMRKLIQIQTLNAVYNGLAI
jgi:hypothetical protein